MDLENTTTDEQPIPHAQLVGQLLLEDVARELAARASEIGTAPEWQRWRAGHARTLAAIYALLPDCPARRRLTMACREAKALRSTTGPKRTSLRPSASEGAPRGQ